jgi:cation diffusion facilitator family transporter
MQKAKQRAALLSITSNSILIVLKLAVGIAMQSVSVISEAIHSGIDLVAAVIAWIAVRTSGKPADEDHHFGHGKIENVAGTIEALLIFGAAIFIIIEAMKKLASGRVELEELGLGAAVMVISAIANYLVSRHLLKVAKQTDSIALEADAMHLRTDVVTSIGVLGGIVAIKLTGLTILDPVVAIVVALLIIKAAYDLTKSAFVHLLDIKLPPEDYQVITGVLSRHSSEYLEAHDLRTRKSGHIRHVDFHLVVPRKSTVESSHALSRSIANELRKCLEHSQVLVHIEPCSGECEGCRLRPSCLPQ